MENKLSIKKHIVLDDISRSHGNSLDLESIIMYGIGSSLEKIDQLISEKIVVDVGDGFIFEIEDQDYLSEWKDRLRCILDSVKLIDVDFDSAVEKILIADGWGWNRLNLKTPTWMFDFKEIPLLDVIGEFKEMIWIEKYM